MIQCKICNKELKNTNGLAKHITNQHPEITKEEYYDSYIKKTSKICDCGSIKKFRDLGVGYLKYCNSKCYSIFSEPTAYWTGKKQPIAMIEKRQNTIEKRFGVNNGFLTNQAKCEQYKGFTVRSSYEKIFLDYCFERSYTVSVPKKIRYKFEGRTRWYYPDFYISELDLIVEVKSRWTFLQHYEMNIAKQLATIEDGNNFIFVNEENGLLGNWEMLDEYICT